jgi:hypothetical protein
MIASLNNGDKLIKTRSRRHETSNASGNHCSIKRFQAKWRPVSRQENASNQKSSEASPQTDEACVNGKDSRKGRRGSGFQLKYRKQPHAK